MKHMNKLWFSLKESEPFQVVCTMQLYFVQHHEVNEQAYLLPDSSLTLFLLS